MKDDVYGTFKKRNTDDKYNGANRSVHKEDWASGHWENLPDAYGKPTVIRNKEHLRQECEKRGVMAKGLLKSKSQGRGYEMRKDTRRTWI
jgi:hypothetical protein